MTLSVVVHTDPAWYCMNRTRVHYQVRSLIKTMAYPGHCFRVKVRAMLGPETLVRISLLLAHATVRLIRYLLPVSSESE